MATKLPVSEEAVKNATGKGWNDWFKILDKAGMHDRPHKEIARWLWEQKLIKKGWWCQSVTVGYEYHHGKRIIGETADAGFEIGVQKTLDIKPAAMWELIASPEGMDIWLGKGAAEVRLDKGEQYQTADGTKGEIRTYEAGRKLRLTWQPKGWDSPSTLQLYVLPSGNKTALHFHQEKLKNERVRKQMRKHWQQVLSKLTKELSHG